MDRDEIAMMFCALATRVGNDVFKNQISHDCFCSIGKDNKSFSFNVGIIEWIERTVNEKIKRDMRQ